MSTAVADARLVTHPPAHSHGGMYVHPDIPQQVFYRWVPSYCQALGESVRGKNVSYSSNEPAPEAIPKGIYLPESQSRYYDVNSRKNVKCLDHHIPTRLQESEYLKQSTVEIKECYFNGQQIRRESSTAETNLHNKSPDGIQKIVRVENIPNGLVCSSVNDARSSTMQYESSQQVQVERYHAQQNKHHPHEMECLSEKKAVYLKHSAYRTQTTSVPMPTGNPTHLAFSEIHSSNTTQLGPKYTMHMQNPGRSSTAQGLKHLSHPTWPNSGQFVRDGFHRPGSNGIYPISGASPQHSVHFHSQGSPYSVSESEPGVFSAKHQVSVVAAANAIQPTLQFSRPEAPPLHHFPDARYHPPIWQKPPEFHSASTFRMPFNGIHTTLPAKPSASPHHSEDKPLSSGDPNVTKCYGHCETSKHDSTALPVHPIPMNTVPADTHLLTYPPARQVPVYMHREPIKNHSQKADSPVSIVYVPVDGTSCGNAPKPCHTCQTCPAEDYTNREVHQPIPINASQSFEINARVQHTKSSSISCGPSQVNGLEGLVKVPIQHAYQPTPEGFCHPVGREGRAPDYRIDLPISVHHDTTPYSKPSTTMAAPTGLPSTQHFTMAKPHFGSMNGHVPAESKTLPWSENSAFKKVARYQGAEKDLGGPRLEVSPWVVPKQQKHNNSEDSLNPINGCPSNWSDNIFSRTSPHTIMEYPAIPTCNAPEGEYLLVTKEPRCYISVDAKPQVDLKENKQPNMSKTLNRFHDIRQSHQENTPFIQEHEQPETKLEKLTKFVVGVESKIQWNKVGAYNKSKPTGSDQVKDLQIVSISSTPSPRDDLTPPSNSSGSESEDPICMIRLERVYYSTSAMPCAKHGLKGAEYNLVSQERKPSSPPGVPDETRQANANSGYSPRQTNSAPFESKSRKAANKNSHKTPRGSVAGPVKRKANDSSAIKDKVYGCAKRKKIEKNKSAKQDYKTEQKETHVVICKRIHKRCARKVRINS